MLERSLEHNRVVSSERALACCMRQIDSNIYAIGVYIYMYDNRIKHDYVRLLALDRSYLLLVRFASPRLVGLAGSTDLRAKSSPKSLCISTLSDATAQSPVYIMYISYFKGRIRNYNYEFLRFERKPGFEETFKHSILSNFS